MSGWWVNVCEYKQHGVKTMNMFRNLCVTTDFQNDKNNVILPT